MTTETAEAEILPEAVEYKLFRRVDEPACVQLTEITRWSDKRESSKWMFFTDEGLQQLRDKISEVLDA